MYQMWSNLLNVALSNTYISFQEYHNIDLEDIISSWGVLEALQEDQPPEKAPDHDLRNPASDLQEVDGGLVSNGSQEDYKDMVQVETGETLDAEVDATTDIPEEEKPLDDDIKIKLVEEEDGKKEEEPEDVNSTAAIRDYASQADKQTEKHMQPFRETLSELEMLAKVGE